MNVPSTLRRAALGSPSAFISRLLSKFWRSWEKPLEFLSGRLALNVGAQFGPIMLLVLTVVRPLRNDAPVASDECARSGVIVPIVVPTCEG